MLLPFDYFVVVVKFQVSIVKLLKYVVKCRVRAVSRFGFLYTQK